MPRRVRALRVALIFGPRVVAKLSVALRLRPALGSLRSSENWQQRGIREFFNSLLGRLREGLGSIRLGESPGVIVRRLRRTNLSRREWEIDHRDLDTDSVGRLHLPVFG